MLVLSRKERQQIIINNNIVVEVIAVHGNRVKIGVVAPKEVEVVRSELVEKETK